MLDTPIYMVYNCGMKKESDKMKLEVFENGRTVGWVCGKDVLEAYSFARKYFPNCTNVDSGNVAIPVSDSRCVKINDNLFHWVLN